MKKLLTIISFILSFAIVSNAQPVKELKADQILSIAEEQYENGDYYNALDWYNKVLEVQPDDLSVIHKIASLHYELRDMKNAASWYSKVVKKDKENAYPNASLVYGRVLKMNGDLDDAEEVLNAFIQNSDDDNAKTLAASELSGIAMVRTMKENEDVTVEDAGNAVNSPYTDFSPIYVTENEMYYGAMVSEEVIIIEDNKDYFAKVYSAVKTGDEWGNSKPLGDVINRPGVHTGNVTISEDGNVMYFTRAELVSNKMMASYIYMSEKSGDGWGAAQKVEGLGGSSIIKQPAIGEMFGEPALFFVSNQSGGFGGWDVYYAPIDGLNAGSPVNLGDKINTVGDEVTPFYQDGNLYFSSTGHAGIGGLDVFKSEWSGSWSAPENQGMPINSSFDDIYFNLDKSTYKGFVVSNRPSSRSLKSKTCCDDIYNVSIKEVILDLEALTFESGGEKLNGVTVQLVQMDNNSEGETESDTKAGTNEFSFGLDRETAYKLIASKDGYKDAVVEFNTVGLDETQTLSKTLNLEPLMVEVTVYDTIRTQTPIRLNNILYDFDKSNIRPDAEPDLNMLLSLMTKYPDMVIELSSHTDSRGKDSYNQKLSQKRAESAKSWLLEKGIADSRIKAVGYGETQPVAANKNEDGSDNPDGRQMNRRTEFKIISGTTVLINERVEKRVVTKKADEE